MKKKLVAGALALTILAGGGTLAFAASQSEMLVSLSYLNGTYFDDLKATVRADVERNTTFLYNEALSKLGQLAGAGTSGGPGSSWLVSNSFTVQSGVNGSVVTTTVGSGLIWTSGIAVVRSGTLVDATAGVEVNAEGLLTVGHRYLAGTDVTFVAASDDARWMAEGEWTIVAGEPVELPVVLPFTDVLQGAWYYGDVSYVFRNGLFNGESPTLFEPENKMQRCMMTTVLHRLAGKPAVGYAPLFRDIPEGQWYTEGTIWAGQMGVVSGVEEGLFDPFSNVTRQEIAVILHRYAVRMGYDVSASASLAGFPDAAAVADWGYDAISWAVGAGLLNGSDGWLLPNGDATRAEVAAMLHRFASWAERQ